MSCFNCQFCSDRKPMYPELNELYCNNYGGDVLHNSCALNCSSYEEDRYTFSKFRNKLVLLAREASLANKRRERSSRAQFNKSSNSSYANHAS
jgi:hypothetical protein